MKRRGLMMVLALVSALLLAGPTAAAKKPAKGKRKAAAGRGEAAKVKRFLNSPDVAKAFRLPKSIKLTPQQTKKRDQLIIQFGRDIREAAQTAKSAITAEGKKFQLGRVKQMQQEGRQKLLAILTPRQRTQAAKGGSGKVKQGGKKRGKKKAGRKKRAKK